MPVNYFSEETQFLLSEPEAHASWINSVIELESHEASDINFIFCSDDYLLELNRKHLNHDYYTDVITFDNTEDTGGISGDVFISIDRVAENAEKLAFTLQDELDRVMVHGVLHLLGYGDKTEKEALEIRKKEDHYLSLRAF